MCWLRNSTSSKISVGFIYIKENNIYMNKITLAQREALDVIKDMIDRSNTDIPEYGTKILTLILGILNIDCRAEHTITDITDNPDNTLPIDYEGLKDDNIKINIPDWIKGKQTPPFSPHVPFPPQVWYTQEPEPIQTDAREDVRYTTTVTCTGDKNCITTTYNPGDVQYTGDFRDAQTSFNDK